MLSIGPFPLPAAMLALSLVVAVIVARQFGKRERALNGPSPAPSTAATATSPPGRSAASIMFDMFFIGIASARLAFVLQWLPAYLADPWSVLRIGDGGFSWWAGLLAALAWGAWKVRHSPRMRVQVIAGTSAGLVAWGGLLGALWLMQQSSVSLPTMEMTTLDDERVSLAAMSGRPVVVNLWATWCPPCRREMPVLAEGQQTRPDVAFVFANQGEGPDLIREYLDGEGLALTNVLLDPFSSLMQEMGARGLPTTLFFDADGRLVDFHMGELTQAGLASKLQAIDRSPGPLSPSSLELP